MSYYLGEEWLIRTPGAYLPGAYEQVVNIEIGYVLTFNDALHMKANAHLVDALGIKRYLLLKINPRLFFLRLQSNSREEAA